MSLDTEAIHHWKWDGLPGRFPSSVLPIRDVAMPILPRVPHDGVYHGDGFLREGDGTIAGEVFPGMSQHIEDNIYANTAGNTPYNSATMVEDWNILDAWSLLIEMNMGPNFRTARYDNGSPPPVPGDGSFNDLQTVYLGSLIGDAISTGSGTVGWAIEKQFLNQCRLVFYHQNQKMTLNFGDNPGNWVAFTVDPGATPPIFFQSIQDNNHNHLPSDGVWWTNIPPPTGGQPVMGQWDPTANYMIGDIVTVNWKGRWHNNLIYTTGDVVRQLASYYFCIKANNLNHDPLNLADTGWWVKLASYPTPEPTITTYTPAFGFQPGSGLFIGGAPVDVKSAGDPDWLGSSGSNAGMNVGYRNNTGTNDNGGANPWTGGWGNIFVWDRALTPEELFTQTPLLFGAFSKTIKRRFKAVQAEPHVLFSRAQAIRGAIGHTAAWDVAGLYNEPGEPSGSAVVDGPFQTVWFKWVAPVSGSITFFTADSEPMDDYSESPSAANKLWCNATVWTGNTLATLIEVDSSNDSASTPLWFDAVEGTTYYFQVGTAKPGENGMAALSWG